MKSGSPRDLRILFFSLLSLALGLFSDPGISQDNLVDIPSFRTGCQALQDERFATASEDFKSVWKERVEAGAGEVEKDLIASRLLESLVRNGESRAAIEWANRNPIATPSPETIRWKALALHSEGRFAEAADQYTLLRNAAGELPTDLLIGMASCLSRSGKAELAYELVAELPKTEDDSDLVEIASVLAEAERYEEALSTLSDLEISTEDRLGLAKLRLETTILLKLNRGDEAINLLFENIETAKTEEMALNGLLLLEAAKVSPESPHLRSRLGDWSENRDHPASSAARLFSPLLLDPESVWVKHLQSYAEGSVSPQLQAEAQARLAILGHPTIDSPATSLNLPGGETRSAYEEAAFHFRSRRFEEAAENFSRLASRQIGENRKRSLFNAALSFLSSGNFEEFNKRKEILRTENSKSKELGDLEYAEGLTLAADSDGRAATVLKSFSQTYPNHPSQIDALLSLAEFHLNQAPARPQAAREIFEELRIRPLTLGQNERFDYASLWLELVEGNLLPFRASAKKFLFEWPNSKYRTEISMLLGRDLYSAGKFQEAEALFRSVATEDPNSVFVPIAQFFEIKAIRDPIKAERGWKKLIEETSRFNHQARHELGLLHLAEGRFEEARSEFQKVAESVELTAPLRFAAIGDIGYAFYREALLAEDPEPLLEEASNAFAKLAQLPEAPEEWVYDAAVRRGKCLEMLGKPTVALEIYESIVQRSRERAPLSSQASSPDASIWVFRAGFAAINILTREKDWEAAIKIAEILSEEDGPRAINATRLAERMRLENWIWE